MKVKFPFTKSRLLTRPFFPAALLLLSLVFSCVVLQAQTLRNYESKVISPLNRPVVGATVENVNRITRTITGSDGVFTIQAVTGDSLKISAPGYKVIFYLVPDVPQPSVTLPLEDVGTGLETGQPPVQRIYTTVPASLNLASNGAVYSPDIIKSPVTSFRNTLTGRLAGLYTLQSSGLPGGDGASLTLRGQAPIFIIDGVVANLSTFTLEEIESVTVLKDALGTAMLGVRGSAGAIVVTTKKGKAERQHLSFTAQTAIQQPIGNPTTLGAYDYARLYNEALVNDGLAPIYTNAALQAYQTGSDPMNFPDVNWRDEVMNKTSMLNRYTLSATGGNRFARYYVAFEHLNQSGLFKTVDSNTYNTNNQFQSYVIRSNVDVSITDKLTGGIYLLGRILNGNEPGATTGSILNGLINTPANAYPVLNPNRTFAGRQQFQNNLLAQTINSGYRQNYKRDMLVNMYLKRTMDDITPGLYMQVKAAYYSSLSETIYRDKSFAVYQASGTGTYTQFGNNGAQSNGNGIDYQSRTDYEEFSIGYDRTFSKVHGINALVLANRDNGVNGGDLPYTITGVSGRLSYNYKGKYIAEAAFGYNGSNRYPDHGNTKRGFFPSIGLGWNIEQESFLKAQTWLSRLKLYGSYGRTGWDNPGFFAYYQRYFDAATTYFGTGASGNTSISEQTLANPFIDFEKANKLNLGIDGAVLHNHLSFTVEYFRNKYFDLMMQRGRNSTLLGNSFPNENIGQNRYSGWEATISWQQAKKDFQYFAGLNASLVDSKVLYQDEVFRQFPWMSRTGQMVGQQFGYIAQGLFQTQAEIAASAGIDGYSAQPGDIKYKDLNSDGIINQFDEAPIGNTNPLIFYGFSLGASYKGFDISALVQGVHNRTVYMSGSDYWAFQNGGFGQAYIHNLNRWTPETAATATYPRLNVGANTNNQVTSSFWVKNGNYLRLKNAEIGYTLPKSLVGKIKLESVRIFANGYNLLTATSSEMEERDPEVNEGTAYPLQRLYNFGINVKF